MKSATAIHGLTQSDVMHGGNSMTLQTMAKHIEMWVIDKLIPYARNPRTHSDAQVAQIAASIREFGFNCPILVDSKAGIIAGHGRLLAARKLGLSEVPVIVLDHLSETQKRAYVIADNKLAENAGWDNELLQLEIAALQQEDFNVDLIGFDVEELALLLAAQDATEGMTDEDAVPELPEVPITRTDDLWILGNHRLVCGDATLQSDVDRLMAGDTADLVFTDPPYNVDYEGYTEDRLKIKGDRMTSQQFQKFLNDTFRSYRSIVKAGASLYVCHSSAATSFSTSRSSIAMWPVRRILGTGTKRSRRSGRRRNRPQIESIQLRSRSSWSSAPWSTAARLAISSSICSEDPDQL